MIETISLDSKTIIVRSDRDNELLDILDFISEKGRQDNISDFLSFAGQNRLIEKGYIFNREACYTALGNKMQSIGH